MLTVFERGRIEENCEAVAKHAKDQHGPLKVRFAEGLRTLMKTPLQSESKRTTVTFCRKEWTEFLVKRGVVQAAEINAVKKLPVERMQRLRADLAAVRTFLSFVNPRIVELLDLIVAEIVVIQVTKPEAGSHSGALGMFWINPDDHWSTKYFAEVVFHELLHQLLFLEDMTQTLFTEMELLEREDTRAFSAVRKTSRHYDSAYHAAFVTIGMMWLYNQQGRLVRGGQTAKIAECMSLGRKAVIDLKRVAAQQESAGRPILTTNGNALLAAMATFFETPDFESINSLLEV